MKYKILLALIAFLTVTLSANARNWEKLGERTVNFKTDVDAIPCSLKGRFKALQFAVRNAPVEFERITVVFGNGERQRIDVRQRINAGSKSRVIDLRGNRRTIKRIEFVYRTVKGWNYKRNKAIVQVYGKE